MRAAVIFRGAGIALAAAGIAAGTLATSGGADTPTSKNGCTQSPVPNRGSFRATLHASGHRPSNWKYTYTWDIKKKSWVAVWPIRINATHNGRAISGGKVFYQFVFSGRIVACRTVIGPFKPYFRSGVMRDNIQWPERSVGIPLTFRAVVRTAYGVRNLNYSVVVQSRR
jgi:hypothetical protein